VKLIFEQVDNVVHVEVETTAVAPPTRQFDALDEPVAPGHAELAKFYGVASPYALIEAQAEHVHKLQETLRGLKPLRDDQPGPVRGG